jgi:hypothetical protein
VSLPPPYGIQVGAADAAEEEIIGSGTDQGIPTLQIAKHANIALKRGQKVIPIPGMLVTKLVFSGAPIKPIFISDLKLKEPIQGVGSIALPAPDLPAWSPTHPGVRKVGAEDSGHPRSIDATMIAPARPGPERLGCF